MAGPRGRSPVDGHRPEALAGVRGRVRSASARRHVEPGDSARGGGWKSLRSPCSPTAALSECRACCISRQSRSSSLSLLPLPALGHAAFLPTASRQRLLRRTSRPRRSTPAAARRREPHRRRRRARASRRPAGVRACLRLERQGSAAADDGRHDLPHRVADESDHERRDSGADGGRPAVAQQAGQRVHSRLRQDDGRREDGYRNGDGPGAACRSRFAIC